MDTKKRIYGIIGYPLGHSLSPAMHNAVFRSLNIDAEYKKFEIKPEKLNDFLDSLEKENIYGLNITIPYKQDEYILNFVSFLPIEKISFYAKQTGAVNTIVRRGDLWIGFNTDVPGFLKHLKEHINPADKKVAILGAGGAGKAVVYAIAKSKAKEIAIFDVDKIKTNRIVRMIKSLFPNFEIMPASSIEALDIKNKDLLINATPIGLKEEDPCLIREEILHKDLFVYDLIYNPAETKLLKLAKEKCRGCSNGLGMLLYQGMLSFEIWTGKPAPQEVMRQALSEALRLNNA